MKRIAIVVFLLALAAFSAAGQNSSKIAELGWLELPSFSEDPEHFFVSHYTDEYWGKQRNYLLAKWEEYVEIKTATKWETLETGRYPTLGKDNLDQQ